MKKIIIALLVLVSVTAFAQNKSKKILSNKVPEFNLVIIDSTLYNLPKHDPDGNLLAIPEKAELIPVGIANQLLSLTTSDIENKNYSAAVAAVLEKIRR